MEVKKILVGILAIVILAGGGYYGYTQYIDTNQDEQKNNLDFDHSFVEHAEYFENVEYSGKEAPSYNEAITRHNEKMKISSYSFAYIREYDGGSISADVTVNRESQRVKLENHISAPNQELIREVYFAEGTEYARLRQGDSNPEEWQYKSRETTIGNVAQTGFNELSSLEITGTSFKYTETIERDGITYYVYEPRIIDEEEFKNNSWRGVEGEPESVSIDGEVLVSEYGVVTSAQVKYSIDDVVVTVDFSVEEFGPNQIKEPLWISEAKNSNSSN